MIGLGDMKRTHMCGELTEKNLNEEVTIMGWVAKERNLGSLIFMDLRDTTGISQIVIKQEDNPEIFENAKSIRSEYVLAIRGVVSERESKNPNIPTGNIEVIIKEMRILDTANTTPIYIKDDDDVSEQMRLKYRYLDLRKPYLQNNLKVRAKTAKVIREFLDENRFCEVETPFLNKTTPEGARDYLVPSRVNPGKFYALPQSPQLMKQLLMISGMDRYYQIVKCFRDEDLRANRQPEFTQVDIEMSFVDEDDVMEVNERLLQRVFKEVKGIDLKLPFDRMSYNTAMENYGSDKPDLRFGFLIKDITDIVGSSEFKVFSSCNEKNKSVRAINIGEYQSEFSRKKVDALEKFAKTHGAKGLAWIRVVDGEVNSPIKKFLSEEEMNQIIERFEAKENGLILIVADKDSVVLNTLGALRKHIAEKLEIIDPEEFAITWITDFPLFEYDEEDNRYVAKHHPFTHPKVEDLDFLETDKEKVRAKAYDIVINGDEIGGGSIRINNSELQTRMFEALGLGEEEIEQKFGFFVEAFKYGTPPHGGIAYGLDRLVMLLTGTENIKDVIAFPKTQSATDLLTGAPSPAADEQLAEIHIDIRK